MATAVVNNPWVRLPATAPFVLPEDEPYVRAYNHIVRESPNRSAFVLDLDLLPVPFCGRWNAPIVVLGLNPFLSAGSEETTQRPDLRNAALASLSDLAGDQPHYSLTSLFKDTHGQAWWRRCVRHLASADEFQGLADSILAVEFHGYFSQKFDLLPVTLPSQAFAFSLVSRAIERDAVIVLTRGARYWRVAVPSLVAYPKVVLLPNWQTAAISPGNCSAEHWALLVDALAKSRPRS